MLVRAITVFIGVPVVTALVFWPGGIPFALLIGLATVLAMLEFYGGSRKGGARPHLVLGVVAGIGILYYGSTFDFESMLPLLPLITGLMLLALTLELLREPRAPFVNLGVTLLGLFYVAWLMLHFIWMRNIPGEVTIGPWTAEQGAALVMFVLLTVWALDTGAYLTGRFYGRTKIAPRLSPSKTVEGAIGGFVSALIVAAVAAAVIDMPQPHGLMLGAIIGVVGQIGDLAESALKREVGIKDFGALIPGHGGVLDRLDSLLFAAPLTFWYITLFLSGWIAP